MCALGILAGRRNSLFSPLPRAGKQQEHHNAPNKTTAGAWGGLAAIPGASQGCEHGARNKEAACPAAGSRANRALRSQPLRGVGVCFGWEAPSQELGEKQTAPCMLPACLCIRHGVMAGEQGTLWKNHLPRPKELWEWLPTMFGWQWGANHPLSPVPCQLISVLPQFLTSRSRCHRL